MYEIKVNGLLMATKRTRYGAYALVAQKYHTCERVTIERKGRIIWTSEK